MTIQTFILSSVIQCQGKEYTQDTSATILSHLKACSFMENESAITHTQEPLYRYCHHAHLLNWSRTIHSLLSILKKTVLSLRYSQLTSLGQPRHLTGMNWCLHCPTPVTSPVVTHPLIVSIILHNSSWLTLARKIHKNFRHFGKLRLPSSVI